MFENLKDKRAYTNGEKTILKKNAPLSSIRLKIMTEKAITML